MNEPIEIRIPEFVRNGLILWVVIAIAVISGVITSTYTVQAESQGVVLRFGKYLKTVEPGPVSYTHLTLPTILRV